jgi:DnaJ-class molecular chaperone
MQKSAFQPEHIVDQIKTFFSGIHDMSDFYLRMYTLSGMCRTCDGRGYVNSAEETCPTCHSSGSSDVWRNATLAKQHEQNR